MLLLFSLPIVFSWSVISAEFKAEPTCSRFHYEEQTLEKLIRLQIFVEKMKEEIDQSRAEVKDTLKKLEEERVNIEHYKDETNTMKENVDKELERVKVDFNKTMELKETINEQLDQTKLELKNELKKELKNELKKVQESVTTPNVVFKVKSVPSNERKLVLNDPIKFSTIVMDAENSYNSTSGMFTAPVTGLYMLSTRVCLYTNTFAYFSIVSNNIATVGSFFGYPTYHMCFTLQTIVSVKVGDELSVRCTGGCDSSDKLWENSYHGAVTQFSGYLMQT